MLSHSNDENANDFIRETLVQGQNFNPETSASLLMRKVAASVVSDDEDSSLVAGPSNAAAQSLPEVLLSLKMTKKVKVAIPASIWARVQNDCSITVRQFNRASPGGYRVVEKTATHLPNSGIKRKGEESQLSPLLSFMVKDFKDNILLLSGTSISTAKNVQENGYPKVSLSILVCGVGTITLYYLE